MRYLDAFVSYLSSTSVLVTRYPDDCKCTPDATCWPSPIEWSALNTTLNGHLIQAVPPGSVCYPSQPNYNEAQCEAVRSQWFNSTWHAENPISIDYPIWANNSCNPIYPNGTSLTGDVHAGKKGCSIGNYPVYVVNATRAEYVSKAFKWAEVKNVRVVVKSTGHSFPGRSTGYGSLSIWTHNFRGIEYFESFKPTSCPVNGTLMAARIAAGQTGVEVQAEMAKHRAIVVTGANPDVGVVGWLTGGGHGMLSTTYGMGADNLLEVTIVTPDGRILVANPCQNPEIFFAIRGGGGGTFGVVLEVVVRAYPTPKTTVNTLYVGSLNPNITTEYWDMIGFIHAEMPKLKEGGMQGYYFIVGPPSVPTLSFIWVFYLYDKPVGTVEKLISPIDKYLKERPAIFAYQSNITTTPTYWDSWSTAFSDEDVATGGAAFGSRLLSPKSLSNPSITARVFAQIGPSVDLKKPNGVFASPILLGHMIASPKPPDYYPEVISMHPAWRNTLVHLIAVEGWLDGIAQSRIKAVYDDITYNKTEPLRKLSPDTGAYFNECDAFEPEWQQAFFGDNYARLRKIKGKYDPNGILWCRRCVGSEDWIEQRNGRLCRAGHNYQRRDANTEVDGTAGT
ncbi:FAD binding domain-containing protein [Lindgomyces ingoldianus]|uniref:FAD binding domain-containing protein n=1 Tax=Lindgomyces ingoldianus TaxID=673940 RepID=A0ACB6R173_9PLEO|nr:FAD binding domain-containing protein [Lindgomyces ingoldianus]KAF2472525.1 FAD binding domain-containing protein [Lindgomyces ingoldianus]